MISSKLIAEAIIRQIPEYQVCLKDRHQRRRAVEVLTAICAHCRRACPLAGREMNHETDRRSNNSREG